MSSRFWWVPVSYSMSLIGQFGLNAVLAYQNKPLVTMIPSSTFFIIMIIITTILLEFTDMFFQYRKGDEY